MPVSKNKRKNGKQVKHNAGKRSQRLEAASDQPSGVSLQDLINVLAYQEYVKDGTIVPEESEINFDDPDTQAIIKAVDAASNDKVEDEDGRQ